jgi:hypothetical protein
MFLPYGRSMICNSSALTSIRAFFFSGVNGHFDHPHGRPWVTIDETCLEQTAKIVGK